MASVQHLFCDAHFLPLEIIRRCSLSEENEKDIHFAAVRIQRSLRGYWVRKTIREWNRAATVIQRYVRGWLVRWQLPQMYAELLDLKYKRYYSTMATKIQALWRGYTYRKRDDAVNVKKAREQRRTIELRNAEVQDELKQMFQSLRAEVQKNEEEEECKKEVIFILYKLHHLLRTHQKEGVFSLHENQQYSALEILMKALPFKDVMQEIRKAYRRKNNLQKERQYLFTSKKMRRMEDLYQLRDRDLEAIEEVADQVKPKRNYLKEFVLYRQLDEKSYEKMVTTQVPYPNPEFVLRQRHPEHDLPKTKVKTYKPYYIDFWTKSCPIHNPPSYFD